MKRFQLIILAVSLAAILLIAVTGTRGGMSYFSPQTLKCYTRSEYTILGGIPIWRSFAQPESPKIIEIAVSKGWLKPQTAETEKWELVFHWNNAWRDGETDIYGFLYKYDDAIIEWLEENPDLADRYWREGFQRYRSSDPETRYIGVRILNTAWRCKSMEELDREIKAIESEIQR
jgi:hypothetical protein